MIYLIGGSPRCGKSTIAKNLSKKLGLSFISTDYLASAMQSKMSPEESIAIFGEKRSNPNNRKNNEIRFSTFSHSEQLTAYQQRAKWNWQGIKNIITYMLDDGTDYVLEGFHLRPSIIIEDLQTWGDKVTYISLYKSNIQEIETGIKINKQPNDWAQIHTNKDETYGKIAGFIYEFGMRIRKESETHGLNSHDMSSGIFQDNVTTVVNQLIGQQ